MILLIGKTSSSFNNRNRIWKRCHQGFTLLEIVVVVIVLMIIAGIAIPNFSRSYQKLQLQETASRLMHVMRYAQSRAITQDAKHRLNFDEELKRYWITKDESDSSSLTENEQFMKIASRWGRKFAVPENITLESPQATIDFETDGKIDKVRVYVCRAGDCLTVSTQEQRGYVQLFDSKLE